MRIMATMPYLTRRESNKQREMIFSLNRWDGSRLWNFFGFPAARRTKRVHLAFRRDVLREDTPWDGAECGARGRICNPLPGGIGHQPAGIMTGT